MEKNDNIIALETFREMYSTGEWKRIVKKLIQENYLDQANDLSYEEGNKILASYLDEARHEFPVYFLNKTEIKKSSRCDEEKYHKSLTRALLNTEIVYLENGEKILDNFLSNYLKNEKNVSLKPRKIQNIRDMLNAFPDKVIDLVINGKIKFNMLSKELPLAKMQGKFSPLYTMSEEDIIIYFIKKYL